MCATYFVHVGKARFVFCCTFPAFSVNSGVFSFFCVFHLVGVCILQVSFTVKLINKSIFLVLQRLSAWRYYVFTSLFWLLFA